MSIEKALADLTAAVEANTAALLGGAAPAAGKAPAASKPAAGKKPAPGKKTDTITVDVIAEKFGTYMKTGSKAERDEAVTNIKKMLTHFDADRLTNIDESQYEEALEMLAQYQNGEDPLGGEEEDEGAAGLM